MVERLTDSPGNEERWHSDSGRAAEPVTILQLLRPQRPACKSPVQVHSICTFSVDTYLRQLGHVHEMLVKLRVDLHIKTLLLKAHTELMTTVENSDVITGRCS